MRLRWKILLMLFLVVMNLRLSVSARAVEDCEAVKNNSGDYANCLQRQIDELAKALEMSKAATAPLESEVKRLEGQITSIQRQITAAEKRRKDLESTIDDREERLALQYLLLAEKTKQHYKRIRKSAGIIEWLLAERENGIQQELGYREVTVNQDRALIAALAEEIGQLEKDKVEVEESKKKLGGLQASLDKQSAFFEDEIKKAKAYQSDLTGQISSLQASILAAKSGSFITSVGDVELADDYEASIKGFRASAPSGSFTVFSFGAYTHRKGMSQYGAKGRALNGQDYDTILRAYFSFDGYEDRGGITIKVNNGNGVNAGTIIWSGSLEEYIKRIYEVPGTWPAASLQAQAISARSYVLAVTNNGAGSICANQYCQVFKTAPKGGDWESAVNATSGKVMVSGGQPVKAYYSSTAGAFSFTKGWDTTDGGGGSNFLDKSWEAKGGSPWALKAWYRQGYSSSGLTCGKSDPWLNNEEFTDIVNAAIVLKGGNDGRIVPVTTSCGGGGGDPYSYAELRSKGGVNSVSSVSVIQGNGVTNEVVINGSIHLTGSEFKKAYNLRAPGYLRIPQGLNFGSSVDFAFFNIEKK